MFKRNEGPLDRGIRIFLGLMLIMVSLYSTAGILQIVLLVLGAVALLTGLTGFCALYKLLGINTYSKEK